MRHDEHTMEGVCIVQILESKRIDLAVELLEKPICTKKVHLRVNRVWVCATTKLFVAGIFAYGEIGHKRGCLLRPAVISG